MLGQQKTMMLADAASKRRRESRPRAAQSTTAVADPCHKPTAQVRIRLMTEP